MQQTGEQRDAITRFIYIPKSKDEPLGCYEYTMRLVEESAPIYKKLRNAVKKKILERGPVTDQLFEAVKREIISPEQAEMVRKTEKADRKSTRLNSSHVAISYAVFCLNENS